jgi:hypothetical protein
VVNSSSKLSSTSSRGQVTTSLDRAEDESGGESCQAGNIPGSIELSPKKQLPRYSLHCTSAGVTSSGAVLGEKTVVNRRNDKGSFVGHDVSIHSISHYVQNGNFSNRC